MNEVSPRWWLVLVLVAGSMPRELMARPLRAAVLIQDRHGNVMSSRPAPENISEDSIAGVLAKSDRFIVVNAERAAEIRRFRGQDLSDEGRVRRFLTEVDVDIIITGTAWYSMVKGGKGLEGLFIWSVVATLSVFTADSSRIIDGQQFSAVGKGFWDGHGISRASADLGVKVASAVETSAGRTLSDAARRVLLEVKTRSTWTPAMTQELRGLIEELPGIQGVSVYMQGQGLLVMYIQHESTFERLSAELEELSSALKHLGSSGGKISLQHVRTPGGGGIAPRMSLQLNPKQPRLYTALGKYHEQAPWAELTLNNEGVNKVKVVAVTMTCGDRPALISATPFVTVARGREMVLPLRLSSASGALPKVQQTESLSCRIEARFKSGNRVLRRGLHSSVVVHGPNEMSWAIGRGEGIAAFVTPYSGGVKRLTDDLVAHTSLTSTSGVMSRLAAAFGAAYEMVPPNAAPPANQAASVITVQKPDETLQRRSGNPFDVAVLLASMLENMEVRTVLVRSSSDLLVGAQVQWPLTAERRPESTFEYDGALYAAVLIRGTTPSFQKARRDAGPLLRVASTGAKLIDVRGAWRRGFRPAQDMTDGPSPSMTSGMRKRAACALEAFHRDRQVRIIWLRQRLKGEESATVKYRTSVELALLGDLKGAMRGLTALEPAVNTMNARGNIAYLAGDAEAAMNLYAEALRYDSDSLDPTWNSAFVGYDLFKGSSNSTDDFERVLGRLFDVDPKAESALLKEARQAIGSAGGLRGIAARVLRWGL